MNRLGDQHDTSCGRAFVYVFRNLGGIKRPLNSDLICPNKQEGVGNEEHS
jgi:hypothetical protein